MTRSLSLTAGRRFCLALAAALGCLTIGTRTAEAVPITITLTGVVDGVDAALTGTFSVGQALSASYTFESTTPPRAGSNSTFAVFDALTSLAFTIGSYSASAAGPGPDGEIQVDNNPPAAHDRYAIVSTRAFTNLTGPNVAGQTLDAFGFRLDDSTDAVFSNALNLPTSLSLAAFDSNRFFVFFSGGVVTGTLDNVTTSTVPEPATLMLLGIGLTALAARQRRRKAD